MLMENGQLLKSMEVNRRRWQGTSLVASVAALQYASTDICLLLCWKYLADSMDTDGWLVGTSKLGIVVCIEIQHLNLVYIIHVMLP